MTAYEAIGGEGPVRAVLDTLYEQLFADPVVGFLFEGKNRQRIVDQQVALTCAFLGGPQRYEGLPLPEAHSKIPLLPGHFDRRHLLLERTLRVQGVPESAAEEWLRIDRSLRTSVLAAGEDARAKTHEPDDAKTLPNGRP
jgi:hemoglobin